MACPLCLDEATFAVETAGDRRYLRCPRCDLTFLSADQRPNLEAERAEYGLHHNDPGDPAYRAFLRPAIDALVPVLEAGAHGLDFGCGPGPAVAPMLAERGFSTTNFDPLFYPDSKALRGRYSFITCTEVAEHLHRPGEIFAQLASLLLPGGVLLLMTERRMPETDFPGWRYRREASHVCFYSDQTMSWIANTWRWELSLHGPRVALFSALPCAT